MVVSPIGETQDWRNSSTPFKLKQKWSLDKYLEKNIDSQVSCIRFNETGFLAMSIKQKDTQWRIDLFNMQLQRIYRGVLLTDKVENKISYDFNFIPLNNLQWFAVNGSSEPNTMLLINKSGTLKQWTKPARGLTLMGREFLVLCDSTGLHFYRL